MFWEPGRSRASTCPMTRFRFAVSAVMMLKTCDGSPRSADGEDLFWGEPVELLILTGSTIWGHPLDFEQTSHDPTRRRDRRPLPGELPWTICADQHLGSPGHRGPHQYLAVLFRHLGNRKAAPLLSRDPTIRFRKLSAGWWQKGRQLFQEQKSRPITRVLGLNDDERR